MESEIFGLADELSGLRSVKRQVEDRLRAVNAEIEAVEAELAQRMIDEEVQNFSRGGQLFYLTTRTWANPVAGKKQELYTWLREHDFGDLVQETVNSQTLSAWVREQTEDADLPEELRPLINVYEKQTISIRRNSK